MIPVERGGNMIHTLQGQLPRGKKRNGRRKIRSKREETKDGRNKKKGKRRRPTRIIRGEQKTYKGKTKSKQHRDHYATQRYQT